MLRHTRTFLIIMISAAVLGWGVGELKAQDSQAKGSISGTVLDRNGKPLPSFNLRLERIQPAGMRPGGKKGKSTGFDSGAVNLQDKPGKGVKIVGRATTDAQGKFSITNVEPGGATLIGGNNKQGWIYADVAIEPGKNVDVGELKLAGNN